MKKKRDEVIGELLATNACVNADDTPVRPDCLDVPTPRMTRTGTGEDDEFEATAMRPRNQGGDDEREPLTNPTEGESPTGSTCRLMRHGGP